MGLPRRTAGRRHARARRKPQSNPNTPPPPTKQGRLSIGLLYWLLAREVLRLRGTIPRDREWDVPVDLFFYREPDEIEKARVVWSSRV